jgi:hypothetical protein
MSTYSNTPEIGTAFERLGAEKFAYYLSVGGDADPKTCRALGTFLYSAPEIGQATAIELEQFVVDPRRARAGWRGSSDRIRARISALVSVWRVPRRRGPAATLGRSYCRRDGRRRFTTPDFATPVALVPNFGTTLPLDAIAGSCTPSASVARL